VQTLRKENPDWPATKEYTVEANKRFQPAAVVLAHGGTPLRNLNPQPASRDGHLCAGGDHIAARLSSYTPPDPPCASTTCRILIATTALSKAAAGPGVKRAGPIRPQQ